MKSSKVSLKKRGYIEESEIINYQHLSEQELITILNSTLAYERTIAVRLLSKIRNINDLKFAELLLKALYKEKSLYSKLEICNLLKQGNINVARLMTRYLGCIGNNQYKQLPKKVSKKKSYPLPRDIIARSLAKMDPLIIPALIEVLHGDDISKLSEAIDAIGFILFYNQNELRDGYYNILISTMQKYHNNNIIYWKCVTCLSAFNTSKSISLLKSILTGDTPKIIKQEANRSLLILKQY
ncbi:hypothetical protein IMX26_11275 [Clostridium sp. 'deep sea']|uniref:hypothetical protein n=1 Tax=Clostridium sp. 'deep sea' TaxID=2779445 RepID=UPI001896638A|nr:hypothetical protein [Clostridium sp. 'deep sea']QOR34072.1 hypothetical protein IMX26_11275 [Clostridium sp. 'deep sea']